MPTLNVLVKLFLLPGSLVVRALGLSLEEDGGILRSLINMLFWGALLTPLILIIALKNSS